ncbi:hypothetical protein JTE90_026764 [Oedothorax gibbosus]|uniref:Uncharacterized protein n=1 Tax=Oedothorax gibbosus TaxID=931172 RepID=A0AAV6UYS0_9ARAC|nr:hypothetical protein JTE90_026764 [Oedothorax gibbosus]
MNIPWYPSEVAEINSYKKEERRENCLAWAREKKNMASTHCVVLFSLQQKICKTAIFVALVAQWIRHRSPKPGIAGSSPAEGTDNNFGT